MTEGGKNVKYVTKQEAPNNCKELSEVNVGQGATNIGESSVEEVKIAMRNQTAKVGGNFLVIDTVESKITQTGYLRYAGTGRAYKCD